MQVWLEVESLDQTMHMKETTELEQLSEAYQSIRAKCLEFLQAEHDKDCAGSEDSWVSRGMEEDVEKAVLNPKWAQGSDFVCVRGRMKMKHSPQRVLDLIIDCENRTAWDDALEQGSFIKQFAGNADLIRLIYKGMWPVWPRDLCLFRSWCADPSGACWLIAQSVQDAAVPEEPDKYVRAELGACGYMMKPTEDGCEVVYISQTKFNGYIPIWMNNTICEQQPMSLARMNDVLNASARA
jgi:hypothetical protein